MKLWEAPEVVESDAELIECAKKHDFLIYKIPGPLIRLKPCICGRKFIKVFVGRLPLWDDYGTGKCWCPECGLVVKHTINSDTGEIDWIKFENEVRRKWNNTIDRIYEKQSRDISK